MLSANPEDDPFQLVIMDWRMPEMDGIETSRRITSERNIPTIPTVIMVTAYGREGVRRQAEDAGIKAFLVKPVTPSDLFDTIMEVFGAKHKNTGPAETTGRQKAACLEYLEGTRLLVAEDNEVNQLVARELLQSAGMEVVIAADGARAVDEVGKSEFDIVLMDIQMPRMGGIEAMKLIRAQLAEAGRQSIPIVALTANAMQGASEEYRGEGMDDYLTKPINPKALEAILMKWLVPIVL